MYDVSKRTLKRDKASGRIRTHQDKRGWNYFDPSDLNLEYGVRNPTVTDDSLCQNRDMAQVAHSNHSQRISDLERQLEREREERARERTEHARTHEEYRQREERLLDMMKRQTLLLENTQGKKGFWSRLFS